MAGATVIVDVSKGYPKSRQWVDFKYETTRTDAMGDGRSPASRRSRTRSSSASYHPCVSRIGLHRDGEFKPLAALRDGSATLHSGAGTVIEGRVLSPTAGPCGCRGLLRDRGRRYANAIPPLKTDAEGRVHDRGRAGDGHDADCAGAGLRARPADHPRRTRSVARPAHAPAGPRAQGSRRGSRGEARSPDASLTVSWAGPESPAVARRGNEVLAHELKTDADGRFAWKDAPDRGITASVWADGFAATDSLSLAPERRSPDRADRTDPDQGDRR